MQKKISWANNWWVYINYWRSKMSWNNCKNENNYKFSSCKAYIVFMKVVFTIFTGITIYLFITIGLWLKIMLLALSLIFTKKHKFGECNI